MKFINLIKMNDSLDEQIRDIKKLISIVWELREKCPWIENKLLKL